MFILHTEKISNLNLKISICVLKRQGNEIVNSGLLKSNCPIEPPYLRRLHFKLLCKFAEILKLCPMGKILHNNETENFGKI